MLFLFIALLSLGIGSAWIFYYFKIDADNSLESLKSNWILNIAFLLLFGFSAYYAYLTQNEGVLTYAYASMYISMVLSIAFIDIKTGYLYDLMLGFYALVLAGLSYFIDFEKWKAGLLSMFIVFLFYGLIYVLARFFYKREAFGTGDIFFVTVVAMNMQPLQSVVLAFMAFYLAAIYLLLRLLFKGKTALSAEIAFCPYIAFAGLIMFLFEKKMAEILAMILY